MEEAVLVNGFVGSVVSDYFWALCVVWTTPLVATLGMSLTIPIAMVADMVIHGRHYSAIYVVGSAQVFAGFVKIGMVKACTFGDTILLWAFVHIIVRELLALIAKH